VAPTILSPEQHDRFDLEGVLRLQGLLSPEGLKAARAAVLAPLQALGLWRGGAWTAEACGVSDRKLKTPRTIGNKHPELRALLDEPAVQRVIGELLGGRAVDRSIQPRPQVLFTLPNAQAWSLPSGWHADVPRLASGRSHGVQLFILLDLVEPGGGGTVAIAGSHRLLNLGRHIRMKELRPLLCREPFFRELYSGAPRSAEDSRALMARRARIDGVEVKIVELTGQPGDLYVTDLRVLHSIAPNAGPRPRLMLTDRFTPADVVEEVKQAFGWS
jgi:hypothetical protein